MHNWFEARDGNTRKHHLPSLYLESLKPGTGSRGSTVFISHQVKISVKIPLTVATTPNSSNIWGQRQKINKCSPRSMGWAPEEAPSANAFCVECFYCGMGTQGNTICHKWLLQSQMQSNSNSQALKYLPPWPCLWPASKARALLMVAIHAVGMKRDENQHFS